MTPPPTLSSTGSPAVTRSATLGDVRAIAEFQTRCWRDSYAGLVPQDYLDRVGVTQRELRWKQRISTGSRNVALAEIGTRLVGVVSWGLAASAEVLGLELKSLYVLPEEQSTGLGSQLLHHAVLADPAFLWVFEDNLVAHSFYRKHGFSPSGRCRRDPDTGLAELMFARS